MSITNDAGFWDRTARKYARDVIKDQAGYERTLNQARALLKPGDKVLELGCGTGTTALLLAGGVREYLATDISAEMIAIANEKLAAAPMSSLAFRVATAETLKPDEGPFDAILAFNYLHMVRDLPGVLSRVHAMLPADGLFISKTPCLGEMNPLIRLVLPLARAIGKAPHVGVFKAADLSRMIGAAGFDVLVVESHATNGGRDRPYIVARKT